MSASFKYSLLVAFSTVLTLSSCNKRKIQNKGCEKLFYLETIDSCHLFLPNIFTPNGDGLNDVFQIRCNCDIELFELSIKDKYNSERFYSLYQNEGWDGTENGKKLKDYIYSYSVNGIVSGTDFEYDGEVTMISNTEKYKLKNCDECFFDSDYDGMGSVHPNNLDNVCN